MEILSRIPAASAALRISCRAFSTTSPVLVDHHKILILGGGCGGASTAGHLTQKFSPYDIAVVEPSNVHYYQPVWTLVGAGIRTMNQSCKHLYDILPPKVTHHHDSVIKIEPNANHVFLDSGKELTYEYLILALGITLRYDLIPGATEALENDPRVCSNYHEIYVQKTFKAETAFKGGNVIFNYPPGPVRCAGAPQKAMYLFEDYLERHNKRDLARIDYFTSLPQIFAEDRYVPDLERICRQRNIRYHLSQNLIKVDHKESTVTFENTIEKTRTTMHYDFLHICPPMTIPEVLKDTPGLTNPEMFDFVDVDQYTLRHKKYGNIFAIGDCAALPTAKTAAAVCCQASTLTDNLCDVANGGKGDVSKYDGYTACAIVTGVGRGVMPEFGYENIVLETFPFSQGKERYLFWFIKTRVLAQLYWLCTSRGLWSGPKYIRKILHLGFSN